MKHATKTEWVVDYKNLGKMQAIHFEDDKEGAKKWIKMALELPYLTEIRLIERTTSDMVYEEYRI